MIEHVATSFAEPAKNVTRIADGLDAVTTFARTNILDDV